MKQTLIDIVTPTFNSQNYLEATVLSLQPLIHSGASYLAVDSGSTDKTLEILRRQSVQYAYCPPGNMYKAVNLGLYMLKNEWCTYINSDDILYSDSISDALDLYGDDADIIYGITDYIDSCGRFMFCWKPSPVQLLGIHFAQGVFPFSQPGTLFRRNVWESIHAFNENYKYVSDMDFFIRCHQKGFKFAQYTRKPLAAFRMHPSQLSTEQSANMKHEAQKMISTYNFTPGLMSRSFSCLERLLMNSDSRILRYMRLRHL